MNRRQTEMCLFAVMVLACLAQAPAARAGWGDSLKKKVTEKVTKKSEEVDKAAETPDKAAPEDPKSSAAEGDAAKGSGAKVSTVSTKFDYVPGDSVLFMDDFTQDDLGEFPARWTLKLGTFETAERAGERWLRCAGSDGTIRMKLPQAALLPEFWTLEFDYFDESGSSGSLTVRSVAPGDNYPWEVVFPQGTTMAFRSGDLSGSAPYEGEGTVAGRHHIMFMARGKALKGYVDRQRAVNIPEIWSERGMPLGLEFRLWADDKPMITNVRFAEGCRPAKDMLAKGKLVTYGIHFATGSDVVLPESAPILRQIAAYMVANAGVRLKITGHTDNVGSAPSNLDLSKRRAASVAKVLSEQFNLDAGRFASDGKGSTQAVSSNTKPEGRAMNRRVEFSKL